MVKWIESIEFVEDLKGVGMGEGGYAEDHEYFGDWRTSNNRVARDCGRI